MDIMKQLLLKHLAVLLAFAAAGCTMKSQEAPPLSGPSEYGTSIGISIAPDVLTQDGASQSLVSIMARDSNGKPLRNVSLRAEIEVGGVRADFGSLSARNLVTGADGRASLVYTAPGAPSAFSVDNGTVVNISITPVGTDFNNSSTRTGAIRLVPPGVVVPPDGLRPNFTFTPAAPTDNQTVLFDASTSASAAGNGIVNYAWNFGDGDRGSGVTVSHEFAAPGSYVVTLTISDAFGRSAQKSTNITVGAGLNPTAAFTSSPTDPAPNQQVNFNASQSKPTPGRAITRYDWDFGDGTFGQGLITAHTYTRAGTYKVLLTVTDDSGKKASIPGDVKVGVPEVPK